MKTAMQKHLEWLKTRIVVTGQMEHELLEQEKQQIIDAYIDRIKDTYQNITEAEQYYNQTFKQD